MSEDRDKLLQIMRSLDEDYKAGKISAEKYRYFRSKYEDKLNAIDAMEASKRIRSMQGKPNTPKNKKRRKKPTKNKKKEEQDLVQKYIINPKKEDAKYNKKQKSSMSSGKFRLIAILVLVIAFTAGVAYGIFNLDTGSVSNNNVVAIVEDTAFPEIHAVVNTTNVTTHDNNYTQVDTTDNHDDDDNQEVETTTETTTTETTTTDTSDSSDSNDNGGSSSDSGSSSSDDGGGSSSDSGGSSSDDGGGSSDSGGSDN